MGRGSEALAKAWKLQGALDLKAITGVVEELDKHLIDDILVKGQPKPDWIRATAFSDDPERCGTTVAAILRRLQGIPGHEPRIVVFPKGIPFPDQFGIEVQIGQGV
jgi:hypothetical protein